MNSLKHRTFDHVIYLICVYFKLFVVDNLQHKFTERLNFKWIFINIHSMLIINAFTATAD